MLYVSPCDYQYFFSDDVYLPPCMKCGKCHNGDTYEDQLQRYICENNLT